MAWRALALPDEQESARVKVRYTRRARFLVDESLPAETKGRVAVLVDGRIEEGGVTDVLDHPRRAETRAFLAMEQGAGRRLALASVPLLERHDDRRDVVVGGDEIVE